MNIIILENRIQDLLSSDCGPFQLYFYKNFKEDQIPFEKSGIVEHKNLTIKTLQTVLNEIFVNEVNENQQIVKKFEEDHNL